MDIKHTLKHQYVINKDRLVALTIYTIKSAYTTAIVIVGIKLAEGLGWL